MDDIHFAPSRHTPKVNFRFSAHHLSLEGEAYPENAGLFFAPLIEGLAAYLARGDAAPLLFAMKISYMNSASTKMIFQLVNLLDQAAQAGREVVLQFEHDPDDELVAEFAEDLAEDFSSLVIEVRSTVASEPELVDNA